MNARPIGTRDGSNDVFVMSNDMQALETALAVDTYHPGTTPEFFTAPNTTCFVFENDKGPVLFVRGTSALRVDLCFTDNEDIETNKEALLQGIEILKTRAKDNGYTELVGYSNSLKLMQFFKNQDFEVVAGEMRILL